ncbi:hypothetical protein PR048_033353 [Dryococelus australis]|uniref:Uncharacterized protein n=1 Tax=Dryococelus australis TaxID=614101 RepID=A0ABQ9G476_9NEOP|nr:hypothetical protein PR048_033353 [Dryococelus australis]
MVSGNTETNRIDVPAVVYTATQRDMIDCISLCAIKEILLGKYQCGSPLVDDRPIMIAVKYRVVSGMVWTNRTMVSSRTDTNRTGVLAVVDIDDSLLIRLECQNETAKFSGSLLVECRCEKTFSCSIGQLELGNLNTLRLRFAGRHQRCVRWRRGALTSASGPRRRSANQRGRSRAPIEAGMTTPNVTCEPASVPRSRPAYTARKGGWVVSLPVSHQGDPGSIPGRVPPDFSHLGIVLDDVVVRRWFSRVICLLVSANVNFHGVTETEQLARSPPTKANRVRSPAGSPDFRQWESCRTMPLVGRFSRGSPVSPATSSALKISLLRAAKNYLHRHDRYVRAFYVRVLSFYAPAPRSVCFVSRTATAVERDILRASRTHGFYDTPPMTDGPTVYSLKVKPHRRGPQKLCRAPARFGRLLTSKSWRADAGKAGGERSSAGMQEQKKGDPRENPPSNDIVRHDSRMREFWATPPP